MNIPRLPVLLALLHAAGALAGDGNAAGDPHHRYPDGRRNAFEPPPAIREEARQRDPAPASPAPRPGGVLYAPPDDTRFGAGNTAPGGKSQPSR